MPTSTQTTHIKNTAWSAGFISYVMKQAGVDFPVNSLHTGYAQSLRLNNRGFQILGPGTPFQVGDILITNPFEGQTNNLTFNSAQWTGPSHGVIVVAASGDSFTTIGGNESTPDSAGEGVSVTRKNKNTTNLYQKLPGTNGSFIVILRPPQGLRGQIINVAQNEYAKWNNGTLKETDQAALPLLQNYYTVVGLPIPGYTVTSGTISTASDYEKTIYVAATSDDMMKQMLAPGTPQATTGTQAATSTFFDDLQKRIANNQVIATEQQLAGELALLDSVEQNLVQYQQETFNVISRLGTNFIPSEQYFLVAQNLFEFFPDRMRQEIASNTQMPTGKLNINTATPVNSHAWRAPGKLATTVDLTIPGAAGFSIGQIFWVDRIYEQYKRMGAFQLFGLTETIDMNRGWTTSIYGRLNIIPASIMLKYLTKQN